MSQTRGINPFEDDYLAPSKEHQAAPTSPWSHAEQSAGDSQFQDQPRGFLSQPPASAPPPPPPPSSESDLESVRSTTSHLHNSVGESDVTSSTGFSAPRLSPSAAAVVHPTPMFPTTTTTTAASQNRYSSSSSTGSSSNNSNYYSSYQNHTRAAPVPMITNYGVSPAQTFYGGREEQFGSTPNGVAPPQQIRHSTDAVVRGDISLRPNTGQTNSEYGGIGSLREVTARLRWMTISCTLSALIWEGFAFPERLLIDTWDHPAKVVLGGYLAFFCLLLLGVELNAPLRDLFGVLYHPLGRGFLLTLMSTMCYGIHIAWWELLLCVAFAGCSLGYLYAYIKYPEYRRWQSYNDNQIWSDMGYGAQYKTRRGDGTALWADPVGEQQSARPYEVRGNNPTWRDSQLETQALLHQV